MARRKQDDKLVLTVRMEEDDQAVIDALTRFERLNMSEVTRRAIRHYAKALGVEPVPPAAA